MFCILCCTQFLWSQNSIRIQNNLGVEALVKQSLIKGNCRNVSNIKAIGDETISIGEFQNGNEIINIPSGIILSTGAIDLAVGPNISSEASFAKSTLIEEDSDLDIVATSDIYDATGIEFDFVPLSDKVSFNYVFASEEYCEFVGTSFNDVFGFFVSGPGINGIYDNNAINVATLIASNEEVSINNINHLLNTEFYIDNVTNLDAEACEIESNPAFENDIEFDGFTVSLKATFDVIPCETYHIRLIIGDVGDAILDSAVFLEANSFDLGAQVNLSVEIPGSDEQVAYEDCVDAQFVFTRSESSDFSQDIVVDYSISPDSEAINGVDFLEIPLSITIPAGDTSFVLPINIINDNITEGPESLKLNIPYDCDCIDPVFNELIINDPVSLSANIEDVVACANQAFTIAPEIIGGVSPLSFLWSTGQEIDTIETSVNSDTQLNLTITDFCGNTDIQIVNIDIQDIPSASLTGTYDICESAGTGIAVQLEGNPPWTIGYSIDGIEQEAITNIQSNTYFIDATMEGNYVLTTFNDANCIGTTIGNAIVESDIIIEAEINDPSCFNKSDGSIEVTSIVAEPPFEIIWSIDTDDDFLLNNLEEGTYLLTIIDADSCRIEKSYFLDALSDDIDECIPVFIPNVFSPNNDGDNDLFSLYFSQDSGITNIISLQIYDRWGSLILDQRNLAPISGTPIWDGRFKGELANPGVYVYKIVFGFEDDSTKIVSGDLSLVR